MIKEIFFSEDRKDSHTKLDTPWLPIPPIDSDDHSIDTWLDTAGKMIETVLHGGPPKSSHEAEAVAELISQYLTHLDTRATRLEQFSLVHLILYYLIYQVRDDEAKSGGWNEESQADAIEKAERILQAPHWPGLIEAGLASQDHRLFYLANRAAYVLDIDTWDRHWGRLQIYPFDSYSWQNIMQRATPDNIDTIIKFALQCLPLSQITAGAADEIGLDPKNQIHRALGTIVQSLKDYPGVGLPLILACLIGSTVGNRDLALKVLAKWGRSYWNPEIEAALVQAGEIERPAAIGEELEKLLQVEPLS